MATLKILPSHNKEVNSLYVHIPFCRKICTYCDFPKYLIFNKTIENDYVSSLLEELNFYKFKKYETIYIGGGTPTLLNDNNLENLLKKLKAHLKNNGEFSIESNVENLDVNKIKILKKYGVNRISIGVQSLNKNHLKYLGRDHDKNKVFKTVKLLQKSGFKNINLDFLYGFKNFKKDDLKDIFKDIKKLNIQHLSFYPLSILPNTMLFNKKERELDEDEVRNQYDYLQFLIEDLNFYQYEVSNYTKNKNFECKHNLCYWDDNYYLGIGVGAASYLKGFRMTNTKSVTEYCHDPINSKNFEKLSLKDEVEYFLITNLRKTKGFNLSLFNKRFGFDIIKKKKVQIGKLKENELIIVKNDYMRPTKKGIILLDIILRELI